MTTATETVKRLKAVPWRGRDALVVFLLPWVVLPVALVFVLQLFASAIPSIHGYLQALAGNNVNASFSLVVVDALGSFAAIGYYLHKYRAKLSDLGLRRFSVWRAVLYLVIILVAFGLLVELAYWLLQALDPSFNPNQPQTNQFTTAASSVSFWALVIIPPFVEESTFRGFMFPAFSKRYGPIVGAVITSILFGFAHLQLNISVYTFILSLLLCGLYVRTGSIIPGIALHMLNNYLAYMTILK